MLDLVGDCNFMALKLMIHLRLVVVGVVNFDLHELALLRIRVRRRNQGVETSVSVVMLDLGQPLEGIAGPIERMQ